MKRMSIQSLIREQLEALSTKAQKQKLLFRVMNVNIENYLIDHEDFDWANLLQHRKRLLPDEFTIWMMNRFGDLFLVFNDDSVHLLDVSNGNIEKLADSRDEFCNKINEGNNANIWLMISLVDELVEKGKILSKGQCYSYIQLPILGGEYSTENVTVKEIGFHYAALDGIHEAIKDIPDGTKIKFSVQQ